MIWKEKYRIGVPLIDEQHQELFRRVTDFVKTLRSGDEWETKLSKVNETLAFMKDYVIIHFGDEEEFQKQIGYPGYDKHREIHQQMVKYVADVAERYEQEGYNEEIIQQFAGKLLAWLINHVAAMDLKIAEYANDPGRGEGGDRG
jgi:hemerythrin